jgi:hypothetical protein
MNNALTKTAILLQQSLFAARGDEVGAHTCQRALGGNNKAAAAVADMISEELGRPVAPKSRLGSAAETAIAVSEAIREAGEIPAGHLYAHLCGELSAGAFDSLIAMLGRAKLVERRGDVLRWAGPRLSKAPKNDDVATARAGRTPLRRHGRKIPKAAP